MKKLHLFAVASLLLSGCAGIDYVDDPIVPERLIISPRISTLAVGNSQTFATSFTNKYGQTETSTNLIWSSSAPNLVSVTAAGVATRQSAGAATVYVRKGNAVDSLRLDAGVTNDTTYSKRGTFTRISPSYNVAGGVRVQTVRGVTQIVMDANFSVSAGPSLYLLLANNTGGSYGITVGGNTINGVSAQITPNKMTQFSGALTFNLPAGVNPANYRYVVLYCSLGPVFGAANLQ